MGGNKNGLIGKQRKW